MKEFQQSYNFIELLLHGIKGKGVKAFTLTSTLEEFGLDSSDWSGLPINEIWEYWYEEYKLKGLIDPVANQKANLAAASRVGIILKQVLNEKFTGQYIATGTKRAGRFGGKNEYSWIKGV